MQLRNPVFEGRELRAALLSDPALSLFACSGPCPFGREVNQVNPQFLTTVGAGRKKGFSSLPERNRTQSYRHFKKDAFTLSVGENRTITY